MAKKEEKVVEVQQTETKNDQPSNKIPEPKVEDTKVEKEGGNMKVTKEVAKKATKPKQLTKKESPITKVNLVDKEEKPEEKEITKVNLDKKEEQPKEEKKVEEVKEEVKEETPALEEITEEKKVEEKVEEVKEAVEEAVTEAQDTGDPLPENIQKVVEFINDTGGSLDDYVRLNQDYDKFEDKELVNEYLKQTKPHLTDEERIFVMEDLYSFDEEEDEPKDIKRKKLALKEQVANAKSHLDGQKSKYYAEVKAGSRLDPEQKKAVDFFNRYNEDAKTVEKNKSIFDKKTNEVFNNEFKGFEYKVGEKRFRLNIGEADKVKDTQSDINNFVSKFTNKKTRAVEDARGYHKSLFTAMNPDLVANHFYEQGKADAIKESMAKAKNVDMSPNSTHPNVVESGGMKVRAISGDTSSDFKVKIGRNPNKIS